MNRIIIGIQSLITLMIFCGFGCSATLHSKDLSVNSYRVVESPDGDKILLPFFYTKKEEIKDWLDSHGIENYTINDNNTVNVDGTVKLAYIEDFNIPVKFWEVKGDFYIFKNVNISNLSFAPISCYNLIIMDCPNIKSTKGLSSPNSYDKIICEWDNLLKGDRKRVVKYWDYYYNKYPDFYMAESKYILKLIDYLKKIDELKYLESMKGN